MPAEDVIINIIVKTNQAVNAMRDVGARVTTMGRNISNIGLRMTAAFTVPLVGLFNELEKHKDFADAFKPIKDAFSGIFDQLATQLVPLIIQIAPDLIDLAHDLSNMFVSFIPTLINMMPTFKDFIKDIEDAVNWFTNLSQPTKDAIGNFILLGGILGPVALGVGQFLVVGGDLLKVLPDLAEFLWTTVAPVVALGLALYAVYKLVNMDEFKKVISLAAGGAAGWTTGSKEYASMVTASTYSALGGGGDTETGQGIRDLLGAGGVKAPSGGAGNQVVVNYNPVFTTSDKENLEKLLGPIFGDISRKQPGR